MNKATTAAHLIAAIVLALILTGKADAEVETETKAEAKIVGTIRVTDAWVVEEVDGKTLIRSRKALTLTPTGGKPPIIVTTTGAAGAARDQTACHFGSLILDKLEEKRNK